VVDGDKALIKLRDSIEKSMTPAQVAEAQRLAREWKPRGLAVEILKLLPAKSNDGGVAVIAPSVSTSMMARKVLAKLHTSEVGIRHADQALVVVRSSLFNPLMTGYLSVFDLQKDADP